MAKKVTKVKILYFGRGFYLLEKIKTKPKKIIVLYNIFLPGQA